MMTPLSLMMISMALSIMSTTSRILVLVSELLYLLGLWMKMACGPCDSLAEVDDRATKKCRKK
jgi:hypothetical protein